MPLKIIKLLAVIGKGKHLVPFRTQKLSPFAVLFVLALGREGSIAAGTHILS